VGSIWDDRYCAHSLGFDLTEAPADGRFRNPSTLRPSKKRLVRCSTEKIGVTKISSEFFGQAPSLVPRVCDYLVELLEISLRPSKATSCGFCEKTC